MFIGAVLASSADTFVAGAAMGLLIGILIGPGAWRWLAWRWWKEANREIRLTDRVLHRLSDDPPVADDDHQAEDSTRVGGVASPSAGEPSRVGRG